MMKFVAGLLAALLAALAAGVALAPASAQAQAMAPDIAGTWTNPAGSVKVRAGPCGAELCGWIVWADEKALADAREAGVSNLIGTMLLQDYRPTASGKWQGRVYVPDMGGTYFSRLVRIDAQHIRISGCILGGWICKSQVWMKD